MSDPKPPKREFNPRSHAMIYLMAIVYLAYLIFQMVKEYLSGGPDAPSFALLSGGIVVLGGGCILLGILAWKMSAMAPKGEDRDGGETAGGEEAVSDEGSVPVVTDADSVADACAVANDDGEETVSGV